MPRAGHSASQACSEATESKSNTLAPQALSSTTRPSRTAGSSSTSSISRPCSVRPSGALDRDTAGSSDLTTLPGGTSNENTVPWPTRERTEIGASSSAARRATMANPRPRPLRWCACSGRWLCTWKNSSKMRGSVASEMPMPLSQTCISSLSPRCRQLISTPPSSV